MRFKFRSAKQVKTILKIYPVSGIAPETGFLFMDRV